MQIIVLFDEIGKEEWKLKKLSSDIQIIFEQNIQNIHNYPSAEVYFILKENIDNLDWNKFGKKPVFLNSVINTLKELDLPKNFSRINGWPTFLKNELLEIATNDEYIVHEIFERLKWKYIIVSDEPGLISARIISMIINEAYFALGDEIASKNEIDIAMKSGTNYPYGPFEWSEKIGLTNIFTLLQNLSKTDSRYNIAPAMKKELFTH